MIEIKTRYDLAIYKEFYWFSLFRGKYYRYGQRAMPFFTGFLIVMSILSFFWDASLLPHIIVIAGAVIGILFYVLSFMNTRSYVKKAPSLFESTTAFVFEDQHFSTTQTGEVTNAAGTTTYQALIKVYETRKAFYLFITPRQAILLSKSDFVKGTPEELRALLQEKLPKGKFILCK